MLLLLHFIRLLKVIERKNMEKMKLNLIVFGSSFTPTETLLSDHKAILDPLKEEYEVQYIFPENLRGLLPDGTTAVFVGSGGVEEMVKAAIDRLPPYVLLIADGLKNSLAASLEILSWMRLEGRQGRVVHGNIDYMLQGVADFVAAHEALNGLRHKRVGVIGKPSGWLIASDVDYGYIQKEWGVQFVDLPLDEVVRNYERVNAAEVASDVDVFLSKAAAIREPAGDDVVKAMRLLRALEWMVDKYRLDAFTLNCFDLIPLTGTTGCVALSLLNDKGIPAGCEGDIQTLLTMLVVKAALGAPSFMANPSQITDNAAHEMIFAHCTIAPCLTDSYVIRSHYESQSGVALEGKNRSAEVTVVKCGGRHMERYFASEAQLLDNPDNPNMCRTQMRLRLHETLDYFLERSIGNHHVIVKGNCRHHLDIVFGMLGASEI
jgi:L-fucose isomerase-like protein